MKETASNSGSEAGRVGDPSRSGPLIASDSATNFELEDGEWDIGIGDLIIDLDADIEKTNSTLSGNTIGGMFGNQMAAASSAKSPKTGSIPIPIQSSTSAASAAAAAAAANSGLKMKFKRTKPSPGTRGSEGKLEIVKSADPANPQQTVDKNKPAPLKKPATAVPTVVVKKDKGKESPVKIDGRPQFPLLTPPIVKVAPTPPQAMKVAPAATPARPVITTVQAPNCVLTVEQSVKGMQGLQDDLSANELDEQGLSKRPKLKRLLSDQSNEAKSPCAESPGISVEPPASIPGQKADCCVGTSVGTMTEPECLGPCEPGTAVTLEGIVWHESEGGVLVVNVTWRGKTYVGTLMDCTRHQWAPPRFCESPQEDLDARGKPRAKRLRGSGPATPQENANTSLYNKLRTTVKGRVTRTATNSGSPLKNEQQQNGTKRKSSKDIEANNNANKRSRSNSRGPETASPSVAAESIPPVCTSPVLLECPVPSCSKKYKHANGLKFHQDHAHTGEDPEQAKCDSEVESVLDNASRRSTPVLADKKEVEVPVEASEEKVEDGAGSVIELKTAAEAPVGAGAAFEEAKSAESPLVKPPSSTCLVVPPSVLEAGKEEVKALDRKQHPEKLKGELPEPSEPPPPVITAEDGNREDVKSPAYSDISDPNDQAPSIDPEFMETVTKFEEPTEPIRNFSLYSVFNHPTPFLVDSAKQDAVTGKTDPWGQERKSELVKEAPKEDPFVTVTSAQYFQPLFIPPEFPPRGLGQQTPEGPQFVGEKRQQSSNPDVKLNDSKELALKEGGVLQPLSQSLPNPLGPSPLSHVQNMVKAKSEKEDRREVPPVIHDFRTDGPPRLSEPIPVEPIRHHHEEKKKHTSKPDSFPEYHHDKNGKLPKPSGSSSMHRSTMSPSSSSLHRSTISPSPKHSKHPPERREEEKEKEREGEDKHLEHKPVHHYEGVKPTMETQGPPPPTGQPTSLNYPYLFPQYMPFDSFRGPGPLLLPQHFPSGSLHSPSFMQHGHPNMQHMSHSPHNHLRFASIGHMMNHNQQEELARVQHSMDFLQHHSQHQFYPMNPPHTSSHSLNLSNAHKIHELSERAMKSPNTSNAVPKEGHSFHPQSPSERVLGQQGMPSTSLPQSAKPQLPPHGNNPFLMGGALGYPHQFVPTSMSGAPSPFTPGKPIFRP